MALKAWTESAGIPLSNGQILEIINVIDNYNRKNQPESQDSKDKQDNELDINEAFELRDFRPEYQSSQGGIYIYANELEKQYYVLCVTPEGIPLWSRKYASSYTAHRWANSVLSKIMTSRTIEGVSPVLTCPELDYIITTSTQLADMEAVESVLHLSQVDPETNIYLKGLKLLCR